MVRHFLVQLECDLVCAGYAVVRQIREKPGTCHTNKLMRDYVDSCTGQLGVPLFYEDTKTYCQGQCLSKSPLYHY